MYFLLVSQNINAQNYPNGFSEQLFANNINEPTNFAFAPDGRLFVCEQTGKLRVIKNGALLNRAFISLNVDASGERGLLGVAFSPQFTTDHWVYMYFTRPNGSNNRIIRVKASGDTAIRNTLQIVLDLDPLSSATNHNGGSIHFGKDGKLFISVGENANSSNSQNLDTYLGKLLRINPDGTVPAGNPYPTGSPQKKRLWCYGLRNPFTFAVDPDSGKIFVNDVGESTWEEVNNATVSNKNFGWPNAEGHSNNAAFTNPVIVYRHSGGNADKNGCAITGGTFFTTTNTNYPAEFRNNYFFLDLCGNWINRFALNDPSLRKIFATNIAGSNVGMTTGPDGNLYFLSRDAGAVYKIVYTHQPSNAVVASISEDKKLKTVVYPSPANSKINIETTGFDLSKTTIKIFDAKGILIEERKSAEKNVLVNISAYENGFYFILVSDGAHTNKIKMEIMH